MLDSLDPILSLLLGVLFAGIGGEAFLRGAVGFSRSLGISAAVVGSTVAAFATSSPELSVSIGAAIEGEPHIALGDALGSNVVNVALILALALLMGPVSCPPATARRDLSTAIAAPLLVGLLAMDGLLSRWDGVLLLIAFFIWLGFAVRHALETRDANGASGGQASVGRSLGFVVIGLVFLVLASELIVGGAQSIAAWLGMPVFVIGALIVAAGTSTPELVATIYARIRGHDEIGLGNILGSNVFNLFFILAAAATIHPVPVSGTSAWFTLGWGLVIIASCWPGSSGILGRGRGIVLLVLYAAFVWINLAMSR